MSGLTQDVNKLDAISIIYEGIALRLDCKYIERTMLLLKGVVHVVGEALKQWKQFSVFRFQLDGSIGG
jgi:hypothetical protein